MFQLYKLTSFNWNKRSVSENTTNLWRFNCTNLHPSTETTSRDCGSVERSLVSIVQTYILQLKRALPDKPTSTAGVSIVQTYILQLKRKKRTAQISNTRVSIVQTYILQLKLTSLLRVGIPSIVSIVQTYILQLKLYAFSNSVRSMYVSIVQTYILQLKRSLERLHDCHPTSFNCTNLHPSTETCEGRIVHAKVSVFQLYKLTSFNWNPRSTQYPRSLL